MILHGDIDDIKFRNDENGYTILTLDFKGEPVVCVGTFPPVTEGECVEVAGSFIMHPRFGKQFKVDSVSTKTPDSEDGVIRFLGSGVIKGVGPKTALGIVASFGVDALKVIEFSPQKLSEIKGISAKKAMEIGAEYGKLKAMRSAVMYLQSVGLGLQLAFRVFKEYGEATEALVRTNPYRMIEDVDGVGFLTADKIAVKSGIAKDSSFRIAAGVIHALKEVSDKNGNTYLPEDEAAMLAAQLLGLSLDYIEEEIEQLILSRRLRVVKLSDGEGEKKRGLMLPKLYRAEKSSATRLAQMIAFSNAVEQDAESILNEFEKHAKIRLHPIQRQAATSAVNNGVSVITGGPGTGKTTIVKSILRVFDAWGISTMLLAPTGRAAKRLSESTGEAASTIHRALLSNQKGEVFSVQAVIVDEVSMIDVYLFQSLLDALRPETRLILVGDKDQLPSVGAGNVLSDILSSGLLKVTSLEQVYRQDEESDIVLNAHRINRGEMPDLSLKSGSDFFFVHGSYPEEIAEKTIGLISNRLPTYLNCHSSKIQVLCPMKMGAAGTIRLNERLAELLNPKENKAEIVTEYHRFRVGDKVMHIANNYDLTWTRANGKFEESGEGVFNGDAGTVCNIDTKTGEIYVLFEDGRKAIYTPDLRSQLILSYAITIHKSQASEFDAIILPIVSGSPMMMTRNLLYTAITRAKKLAVIVGEKNTVRRMVENNFVQKRYSYLKQFLIEAEVKSGNLYGG